ncbi:MAG TPA: hypothetical protein VJH03_24390 [Blastocatellia bacterium]|nr:hypothetical protein [Blastocatellia bacterium]
MGTERFWKGMWAVAVWHNIIGGVGLIFFGWYLYRMAGYDGLPSPGVNYVRWWFLILVMALNYYYVYRDLYNTRPMVIVSILAKVASATPDFYYILIKKFPPGVGVPRIFLVTVCTDYTFAILFALFLPWQAKQKALRAG